MKIKTLAREDDVRGGILHCRSAVVTVIMTLLRKYLFNLATLLKYGTVGVQHNSKMTTAGQASGGIGSL